VGNTAVMISFLLENMFPIKMKGMDLASSCRDGQGRYGSTAIEAFVVEWRVFLQ